MAAVVTAPRAWDPNVGPQGPHEEGVSHGALNSHAPLSLLAAAGEHMKECMVSICPAFCDPTAPLRGRLLLGFAVEVAGPRVLGLISPAAPLHIGARAGREGARSHAPIAPAPVAHAPDTTVHRSVGSIVRSAVRLDVAGAAASVATVAVNRAAAPLAALGAGTAAAA